MKGPPRLAMSEQPGYLAQWSQSDWNRSIVANRLEERVASPRRTLFRAVITLKISLDKLRSSQTRQHTIVPSLCFAPQLSADVGLFAGQNIVCPSQGRVQLQ
ncbi:hypothetical protein D9M71_735740 [compost metagenome]